MFLLINSVIPVAPALPLVFSNASALSALSIYYNTSESYNTFCKQESLKGSEFRKVIRSPAFRFYYNPEVLWRSIKALQSEIFGIHVASGIFKG